MWTYVEKDDLEIFLNKYPSLAENFNEISLYETDDKIFLPRFSHL